MRKGEGGKAMICRIKTLVVVLSSLAFLYCLAGNGGAADKVSCMLDWFPNPDHAPVYVAKARGFF